MKIYDDIEIRGKVVIATCKDKHIIGATGVVGDTHVMPTDRIVGFSIDNNYFMLESQLTTLELELDPTMTNGVIQSVFGINILEIPEGVSIQNGWIISKSDHIPMIAAFKPSRISSFNKDATQRVITLTVDNFEDRDLDHDEEDMDPHYLTFSELVHLHFDTPTQCDDFFKQLIELFK